MARGQPIEIGKFQAAQQALRAMAEQQPQHLRREVALRELRELIDAARTRGWTDDEIVKALAPFAPGLTPSALRFYLGNGATAQRGRRKRPDPVSPASTPRADTARRPVEPGARAPTPAVQSGAARQTSAPGVADAARGPVEPARMASPASPPATPRPVSGVRPPAPHADSARRPNEPPAPAAQPSARSESARSTSPTSTADAAPRPGLISRLTGGR